jgi:hypothetical protein
MAEWAKGMRAPISRHREGLSARLDGSFGPAILRGQPGRLFADAHLAGEPMTEMTRPELGHIRRERPREDAHALRRTGVMTDSELGDECLARLDSAGFDPPR